MDKRTTIYYTDELNDEFSLTQIVPKKIDAEYKYCYDSLWKKFTHVFWYRIVAMPIAFIYTKLLFAHKVVGSKKLKPYRKTGIFIYGNHTQDIGDAFIPNMMSIRQDKYIIVHPNNVSIPCVGRITPSLGAIPLPDDRIAYQNFMKVIDRRIAEGKAVVIYPEAHIWPYYTKIRPFTDVSFHYPVKNRAPVFCFTNTYQKRKFSKKPRIVTYVDGPFLPNESISLKDCRKDLRDRVYECMCERAKLSTEVKIQYIKKEKTDD